VLAKLYSFGFDITMWGSMKTNAKNEFDEETFASVKKEMAKPRMAKSARLGTLNLDTARIPEQPTVTMPEPLRKSSLHHVQPGKAQIAVDGADHRYRNLRIENTLTDGHGDDVRLEKGTSVEVTVRAER
jgi:hypothetical protein